MDVLFRNECTNGFALYNAAQVAYFVHVKYHNGYVVFFTKGKGGHVHYVKFFGNYFGKGDGFVAFCGWVFFGVGGIYAINAGSFEYHVGTNFYGSERRCRW